MFEEEGLSAAGVARREAILRLSLQRARRRRIARRARRGGLAVIVCGAVVTASAFLRRAPSGGGPAVAHDVGPKRTAAPASVPAPVHEEAMVVHWIQTDPTITERLAIQPGVKTWQVLDDKQLLQGLADAGEPSGLVEMDGHAYLIRRQ